MITLFVYTGGIDSFNNQAELTPTKAINIEERVNGVPYQLIGGFVDNIGSRIHCLATPTPVWDLEIV